MDSTLYLYKHYGLCVVGFRHTGIDFGLILIIIFQLKVILVYFISQSSRVTLKMDVSHTDHSHIIGKGGGNIKRGRHQLVIVLQLFFFFWGGGGWERRGGEEGGV